MDRRDVLKFYDMQSGYSDPAEEEVLVASLESLDLVVDDPEYGVVVDVFSRVDRKISLVERVVLASSRFEFVNNCQHAPYPEGRSCDFPNSGEHKDSGGSGSGISPNGSPYVKGPEEFNGIDQVGGVALAGWRGDHGISAESMEQIGFDHYDQTGVEQDPVLQEAYGSDPSAIAQMRQAARQSGGLIMTRHAIEGSPFEIKPILPQTRPDTPILSGASMAALRGQGISDATFSHADNSEFRELIMKDKSKKTVLDHDVSITDAATGEKHVIFKSGETVQGMGAKYLFPAGDGNAARVDLPPDPENVRNFMGQGPKGKGGTVYIAMEGTFKTAAVLTALKAEGKLKEGDSVIGIPSVTLWHRPDTQALNDKVKALGQANKDLIKQKTDLTSGATEERLNKLQGAKITRDIESDRDAAIAKHGLDTVESHESNIATLQKALADPEKTLRSIDRKMANNSAKADDLLAFKAVVQKNGSEMEWTIKNHLQGRNVVLIPDADGLANPNVGNQTRALQNLMETSGVKKVVVAAAPVPLKDGEPVLKSKDGKAKVNMYTGIASSGKTEELKGVDDYLGVGQGTTGKMMVADRIPANVKLSGIKVPSSGGLGEEVKMVPIRRDTAHSMELTLRAVSLIANPETGEVRVGTKTIAGAIGSDHKAAQDNLDRLVNAGILKKESVADMTPARKAELVSRGIMQVEPKAPTWHYGGKKEGLGPDGETPSQVSGMRGNKVLKEAIGPSSDIATHETSNKVSPTVYGTDADDIVFDERSLDTPVYTIVDPKNRAKAVPFHTLESDPVSNPAPGRQIISPEGAAWYGQSLGSTIEPESDSNPDEVSNPFEDFLS